VTSFVSFTALRIRNRGSYSSPFSGVGMEFFPPGLPPDQSGVLLHESGYLARNDWWNFPNTLSPFWRLYYNARPGHKAVFPYGEYELEPGHIMLIPDRQLFHSVGKVPVPHTWMSFQVTCRLHAQQAIPILLRPTVAELHLLRELKRQFNGIGTGNRQRILHVSLALLHLLLSRREIRWQTEVPTAGLQRTIHHMEAHPAAALNLGGLARMAGLSVRGLAKAFKWHRGTTPGHYLTQLRVRQAAEMLVHSQSSIESIAEETGFPNRHYLSRVFKQVTGDTPAHFRHQYGNGLGLAQVPRRAS